MKTISMRGLLVACGLAALTLVALPAQAGGPEVGVSVQISQPGVYGRIDLGQFPQPRVMSQQPVIVVAPQPRMVAPEPVYMWVPPGHRRHWHRHCREYDACGRPVYFVRDDWYREQQARRDHWRDDHGHHRGGDHGDRWDRHHHRDDEERGRGHGRGHD